MVGLWLMATSHLTPIWWGCVGLLYVIAVIVILLVVAVAFVVVVVVVVVLVVMVLYICRFFPPFQCLAAANHRIVCLLGWRTWIEGSAQHRLPQALET